jgi:2-hydroxychromene-2-carboxylate isomerase
MEINPKTFSLRFSSQNIKILLKKKTEDAFDKGIFGAPTFLVNNKIYWGQDRLNFALSEARR